MRILLALAVGLLCFLFLMLFLRARTREHAQVARRLASISEQAVQPLTLSHREEAVEPKERMWEMLRAKSSVFRILL